jgi:hypothetical protein
MLDKLTKDTFSPYLGTEFRCYLDAETWVGLELVDVTPRPSGVARASWAQPTGPVREPFSIVFRGPRTHALQQRMYRLVHDGLGVIDDLFIVPVGISTDGIFYEAIFS